MIGERGPEDKLHLPAYRGGCYYGRVDDCCLLCVGRVVMSHSAGVFRIGTKNAAAQTHELIGERVEIPISTGHEDGGVERVSGEITDVFDLGDEPSVLSVELDTGERLALSIKHLA
ncbi:hypothetical protein [Halalkalicoccus subterraneus]|uniref:hypothetical protein n=1 Tax=Halalkalicoccus subterraneus TaxID=2675002 RepID=UPI000EFADD4E|nr:hypothetical protein [Halalkalicoccus subterraneus]